MARGEWDSEFGELFEMTPGVEYLTDEQYQYAELLFEEGFTHHGDEYEEMGLSEEEVYFIRQEFFDLLHIDDSQFDWQEWREAMGYELCPALVPPQSRETG